METMNRQTLPNRLARYSMRLRMVLLFIGAVAIMVAHHCFYQYLNDRPVAFDGGRSDVESFIIYYSSSIANFMSIATRGFLAAILGIAFAQIFWMQSRRNHYDVRRITDVLACKDSPTRALRSIRSTLLFSAITFLSMSLIVITIIAPGAVDFYHVNLEKSCEVQTVDLSKAEIAVVNNSTRTLVYRNPIAQVKGFVTRVLLSGSPLKPNVSSDDFGGFTTYSLTFDAPVLKCTNITDSFDFTSALPEPISAQDNITVWNAATRTLVNGSMELIVATRELIPGSGSAVTPGGSTEAVSCIPYKYKYTAEVDTDDPQGADPVVTVVDPSHDVDPSSPLSPVTTLTNDNVTVQYYALVDSLVSLLVGSALYNPSTRDFVAGGPIVTYSPMGAALADSPWYWKVSMLHALPELMKNVSASILSDALSESTFPTLSPANATCQYWNVYFVYKPLRLFLPYGIGLLIGALGIALGCYAIHMNGREESLAFGHILKSVKESGEKHKEEGESRSEFISDLFSCFDSEEL